MTTMWDYTLLESLEAVITERGFQKAAQRLFVTQSAVSQRIKQLESFLGQPAIIRSPVIRPTTVGQHLITHLRSVRLLEHSLHEKWPLKRRKTGFQPVGIALNTESLSTWFMDGVKGILEGEKFVLELFIDDQDRTIQLLQKGKVWGCVTSVAQSPQGCKSIRLGEMVYHLVCSPNFKSRHFSKGVDAKSLLQAPAAIYGEFDEMHDEFLGSLFRAYRKGSPTHHLVPSPKGILRFAAEGLAFALLPVLSIESHLQKRQLVNLLPERIYKLPLYWQTLELQTPETNRLSDAIVKHAQRVLKHNVK